MEMTTTREVSIRQCPELEEHFGHYWVWADKGRELHACPGRRPDGASAIAAEILVESDRVDIFRRDGRKVDE